MGTPAFAVPSLEATHEHTELALVITQPDRPAGRKRKLRPPIIKEAASSLGIEVVQPVRSVTRELKARLVDLSPDVIVVAAFGKTLGRAVINLPRLGCINVHASLLPRHQGASPIAHAILAGDKETGVTIQRVVEKLDHGDVLDQRAIAIGPYETTGELTERLALLGAEALADALDALDAGAAEAKPQDLSLATSAPSFDKADGLIDWTKTARQIHNHVRAMSPWPTAYTACGGRRLRVHKTQVVEPDGNEGPPGHVLCADKHGIQVVCGQGIIEIATGQREGGNVCCGKDLAAGRVLLPCDRLG